MLLKKYKTLKTNIRLCHKKIHGQAQNSDNSHIFTRCPFNNYIGLISLLKENIIYNSNGLVILNRPYGLQRSDPVAKKSSHKKVIINPVPCVEPLSHLSFSGVMPYLKTELSVKSLDLIKAPDRFMSGISVLSTDSHTTSAIRKAFMPSHESFCTYLAVCQGIPIKSKGEVSLGLTQKKAGQDKRPFFVQDYSKRNVHQQLVVPFKIKHRTLSYNEKLDVALVELINNRNKWHGLRVYCAQRLLAPVLGDQIFGSHVKSISGIKVAVDVMSPASSLPYKVPKLVLEALQLTYEQRNIIPLHMHFARLNFLKFKGQKGKVFVAKPPAEHFLWTCERLQLEVPEYYLNNFVYNSMPELGSEENRCMNDSEHDEDNDNDEGDKDDDSSSIVVEKVT